MGDPSAGWIRTMQPCFCFHPCSMSRHLSSRCPAQVGSDGAAGRGAGSDAAGTDARWVGGCAGGGWRGFHPERQKCGHLPTRQEACNGALDLACLTKISLCFTERPIIRMPRLFGGKRCAAQAFPRDRAMILLHMT